MPSRLLGPVNRCSHILKFLVDIQSIPITLIHRRWPINLSRPFLKHIDLCRKVLSLRRTRCHQLHRRLTASLANRTSSIRWISNLKTRWTTHRSSKCFILFFNLDHGLRHLRTIRTCNSNPIRPIILLSVQCQVLLLTITW
jgi:hypothetical protein